MDQSTAHQTFLQGWNNYQHVLAGDHLEHIALYDSLEQELTSFRTAAKRPLAFADLGSGDSDYICRLFKRMQPAVSHLSGEPLLETYRGVDLSSPALELAGKNLAAVLDSRTKVTLECQDFLSWAQTEVARMSPAAPADAVASAADRFDGYDAILMSFALHHLGADEKEEMLGLMRTLLHRKGGVMLLVDVFRQEGETLADYMKRYTRHIQDDWNCLSQEAKDVILVHVTKFDIPESVVTYMTWSARVGFAHAVCVKEGPLQGVSMLMKFGTVAN